MTSSNLKIIAVVGLLSCGGLGSHAFAESQESFSVNVPLPRELTADTAETVRANILKAAKSVCDQAAPSTTFSIYHGRTKYRDCVQSAYSDALAQDKSGVLTASAAKVGDPFLIAMSEQR